MFKHFIICLRLQLSQHLYQKLLERLLDSIKNNDEFLILRLNLQLSSINKLYIFLESLHTIFLFIAMDQYSWQEERKSIKKDKNQKSKKEIYEGDFEEQLSTNRNKKESLGLPKIQKRDNIKQSQNKQHNQANPHQEEYYDQDFQQGSNKKISKEEINGEKDGKARKKDKEKKEQYGKERKVSEKKKLQPKQKEINKSSDKAAKSLQKSKKQVQRRNNSMQKKQENTSPIQNISLKSQSKYLYYLKTQFPYAREQLSIFNQEKLNRLNEGLKNYIKMVNDELTDLINQNMRRLKTDNQKKIRAQHSNKSVESEIKVLTEQIKIKESLFESLQVENHKVRQRYESINEQQYEQKVDDELSQVRNQIKQQTKYVYNLKLQMKNQGNKLTADKNFADRINELKNMIGNTKKEEQKNSEKIDKLQKSLSQFNIKTPEIQQTLENLLEKAKKENIQIPSTLQDKRKYEKIDQLKKKHQNLAKFEQKSKQLLETKLNINKKDNDHLRNYISEMSKKFAELNEQISSAQQTSKALIEESSKQKLEPHIQAHLSFIYKNLKEGSSFSNANNKSSNMGRGKNNPHQNKNLLKKYSSLASVNTPYVRSHSQADLKPSFHITKKAPLLLKSKENNLLKISDKVSQQRVWKEGQNKQPQSTHKVELIQKVSDKQQKMVNQLTKKGQIAQIVQKLQSRKSSPSSQTLLGKQQKQNEKKNSFAPKMKFNKQEGNQGNEQEMAISEKNPNQIVSKQQSQEISKQSKPKFNIKRAVKEKAEITEEELGIFPKQTKNQLATQKATSSSAKQKIKDQVNQKKSQNSDSLQKEPVKDASIKGPNFKIVKRQSISHQLANLNQHQPKKEPLKIQPKSLQQPLKSPQIQHQKPQSFQKSPEQQDLANFGGGRRVQRKIQRKIQDSYVV